MRVVILGRGAREHALAWSFAQAGWQVWAVRPTPGMAQVAHPLPTGGEAPEALVEACLAVRAQLVVFGPESPLVAGEADVLRRAGLAVLGPGASGARLEGSKIFAKQWMSRHQLPTAPFAAFDRADLALDWAQRRDLPPVVKADGLAGGKGVTVPSDLASCRTAIAELLVQRTLGSAGERIVLEDRLEGPEVSAIALVSGHHFILLPPAHDYKRAGEGDTGPQTGGMGATAGSLLLNDPASSAATWQRVADTIFAPAVAALQHDGILYHGILYAGLMLTSQGPKILEFNVRLGDPEAQALLPLLGDSFAAMASQAAHGALTRSEVLDAPRRRSTAVVLAAQGYPGPSRTDGAVEGLSPAHESSESGETHIFQGTTAAAAAGALTHRGGRIATIVGVADTPMCATALAYQRVERVQAPGGWWRSDIGHPR